MAELQIDQFAWRIKFSDDKRGSALFSGCERYRYTLTRDFSGMFDSTIRWLNMLMLNPSTATENELDQTVARQCKRAEILGCQGLTVTNIFAWRDTDPRKMKGANDPVGPLNDHHIRKKAECAIASGGLVVAGWGNHGAHLGRSEQVKKILEGLPVYALRVTKQGQPEHPLYLPYNLEPKLHWGRNSTRRIC